MSINNTLKKYIFFKDENNEIVQNIDFSKSFLSDVISVSTNEDYSYKNRNKKLHDYIFKFYAYNEIMASFREKNNGIISKEDLSIFTEYADFVNDFSKKIFSYILYACFSEAKHTVEIIKIIYDNDKKKSSDLIMADYISQKNPIYINKDLIDFLKKNYIEENANEINFPEKVNRFNDFSRVILNIRDQKLSGDTGNMQRKIIENKLVKNSSIKDFHIEEILEFLSITFLKGFSPNDCFGGKPWSDIAKHALSFSRGEINAEIFIDQALSLEHNGGNMFNKNFIFTEDETSFYLNYLEQGKNEITAGCISINTNNCILNLQNSCSVLSLSQFKNTEWITLIGALKDNDKISQKLNPDNLRLLNWDFENIKEVALDIDSLNDMTLLAQKVGYSIPTFNHANFLLVCTGKESLPKRIIKENIELNNIFSAIVSGNYIDEPIKNAKNEQFFQFHNLNSNNAKQLTKELIGGKAHGLVNLINKGFNVPKALVFDTKTCLSYIDNKEYYNEEYKKVDKQISDYLINDKKEPLLVSVRSGAPVSMPGMMDSILNVGIDDKSYPKLCKTYGKKVIDNCAVSFMKQFCSSKLNIDIKFPKNITKALYKFNKVLDKNNIDYNKESLFPLSKEAQIKLSVEAVFDSWNSPRAIAWRNEKNISHDLGTAATIQQMVLGNKNDKSLTCVIFSRDCITGKPDIMGEYLPQAQGEDLVSGKTTPLPISQLKISNPKVYQEIEYIVKTLEQEQKAIQDIEITVEDGKVYVLQMRNAVVSPEAQLALAKEMNLNLLDIVQPKNLIGEAKIDTNLEANFIGLAASPGFISGIIVRNQKDIDKYKNEGKDLIFFSNQALPEHAPLMIATHGFITEFGGSTSHAAILARSMGKPCVVGIGEQDINNLKSGSIVTINASEGKIWKGELDIVINQEKAVELANQILKDNKIEITENFLNNDFKLKSWTTNLLSYNILENKNNKKHRMFLNIAQQTALILQFDKSKEMKKVNI